MFHAISGSAGIQFAASYAVTGWLQNAADDPLSSFSAR